jgi:regulator of sigma E protease
MDILATFGGIGWTAVTFIVAISIIVAVHEYGHYIVARCSGIHAEVFSLGFGKVLASRVDRRGTKWQIAAIPLGGFVKFMGDANAASAGGDSDVMLGLTPVERRRTMQGAPLWARAATAFAGPLFNFLMAIALFWALILSSGIRDGVPKVASVNATPWTGENLRRGDVIVKIAGQEVPDMEAFGKVVEALPDTSPQAWTVLREGAEVTFDGPHPLPALIGSVMPSNAGMAAGLEVGDVILAVNDMPVATFSQMPDLVAASGGEPLKLQVWRGGDSFDVKLSPNRRDLPKPEGGFETRWLIGLTGDLLFVPEARPAGIGEALMLSLQQSWAVASGSLSGLYHIILGKISTCNLSGAISMAENVSAAASDGAVTFLFMLAAMSVAIGLVNLFPIPVLDGGHLVLYAYEAVFRRPPPEKALGLIFSIGLAIVISIMVFALFNDVTCA